MSNRVVVACGVVAAAAVGLWLKLKRPGSDPLGVNHLDDTPVFRGLPQLAQVTIDDDEAAEIITRARPALDRAAKLL